MKSHGYVDKVANNVCMEVIVIVIVVRRDVIALLC